jgi:hypothetical protein
MMKSVPDTNSDSNKLYPLVSNILSLTSTFYLLHVKPFALYTIKISFIVSVWYGFHHYFLFVLSGRFQLLSLVFQSSCSYLVQWGESRNNQRKQPRVSKYVINLVTYGTSQKSPGLIWVLDLPTYQ